MGFNSGFNGLMFVYVRCMAVSVWQLCIPQVTDLLFDALEPQWQAFASPDIPISVLTLRVRYRV